MPTPPRAWPPIGANSSGESFDAFALDPDLAADPQEIRSKRGFPNHDFIAGARRIEPHWRVGGFPHGIAIGQRQAVPTVFNRPDRANRGLKLIKSLIGGLVPREERETGKPEAEQ